MSKRRRFLINAPAVAIEHFLREELDRLARDMFKRFSPLCEVACHGEVVRSAVNKRFIAAVKTDGNDVHLFIDDNPDRLTSAVLELFPGIHVSLPQVNMTAANS